MASRCLSLACREGVVLEKLPLESYRMSYICDMNKLIDSSENGEGDRGNRSSVLFSPLKLRRVSEFVGRRLLDTSFLLFPGIGRTDSKE